MRSFFLSLLAFTFSLILTSCSSLLYYPSREVFVQSNQIKENFQVEPQDVYFRTTDGVKLHGWYFHHTGKGKTRAKIVFFHGNAQNLTTHFVNLMWVLDHRYDFFIFDYEGYGFSEGSPSPERTIEDGKAAIRWMQQKEPKVPLVVFGQSIGGAIALRTSIELKNEIQLGMIVVDSTFLSYRTVARRVLAHHWFSWAFQPLTYLLLSDQYAPGDRVAELSPIPLVVIHGKKDRVVDFELGQEIYEKAKPPVLFWPIENGKHGDSMFRDRGKWRQMLLEEMNKRF